MVTIPRTTPVVREKFLNDDQGLRSFYSLNPWLFSSTPSAWPKVPTPIRPAAAATPGLKFLNDDQGLRSFYSLNPCYVEIVKCVFSVQGLFPSKKWKEPLAPLLPGSRSFPHPFTRTQTRSSIESNDNLLFDAQDQPETPVLHFSLRPDQTGYRT